MFNVGQHCHLVVAACAYTVLFSLTNLKERLYDNDYEYDNDDKKV